MDKLNLSAALSHCLWQIESKLQEEIVGIERVTKVYGTNSNSFILTSLNPQKEESRYFLKFNDAEFMDLETQKATEIAQFLPTPKVIMNAPVDGQPGIKWGLFQHLAGKLITEKFIQQDYEEDSSDLIIIERQKENLLQEMYNAGSKSITLEEYRNCRANNLFEKRLFGPRFNEFFSGGSDNVSQYFDYSIYLNGKKISSSISSIFDGLRNKYLHLSQKEIITRMSHGDAHHGNIIIDDNNRIWFIDNEYAGQLPAYLELSKPYYNDFIGELFYHYHSTLSGYFDVKSVETSAKKLNVEIQLKRPLGPRLDVTKIKIESRSSQLKDNHDPISLNDYLIMCHTLTKNPNNYPDDVKWLFLVFIPIINQFDALKPESIYDFF
jgi:thiamine kinase-like enzyme